MKKTVLWIILDLIFLVIFNALFFVLGGTEHNNSVWISYGFIHFAYLMLILTSVLTRKSKSAAVFGVTIYSISAVYFFIQLLAGTVFILIASETIQATFLVQLCIAGIYGIILVSNLIANERTADAEDKRHVEITYVKDASLMLKSLMDRVSDIETKKKIERVYDAVYSSPVKSHPNVAYIENSILQYIKNLEISITSGDTGNAISLADMLLTAVNDRNAQLKAIH